MCIVAEVGTWDINGWDGISHSKQDSPTSVVYITGWDDLTEHIEDRGPAEVVGEKTRKRERNHGAHVTARACETGEVTAL
jgi:hypothetical protein